MKFWRQLRARLAAARAANRTRAKILKMASPSRKQKGGAAQQADVNDAHDRLVSTTSQHRRASYAALLTTVC